MRLNLGKDRRTLTALISGPGNEASATVPPAKTALNILVRQSKIHKEVQQKRTSD